ncbi:MAG: FUSC family protein [Steroidobacteraceae bacterium]
MVFRIPQPTYMAYLVFVISKDERAATFKSAIGGLLAVTIALIASLVLFTVDVAEPAIRLPAMAITTFVAMYTSRTFALGPISFLAGFVLVLVQSLVDDIPKLETLTRTTLWLWVVVLVPVSVAILTNLLAGQSAAALIKRTVLRVLAQIESALLDPIGRLPPLADQRAELLRILALCQTQVRKPRVGKPVNEFVIRRLLDALTVLEAFADDLPPTARQGLAERVRASRLRIQHGTTTIEAEGLPLTLETIAMSPAVLALEETFGQLHRSIGRRPPEQTRSAQARRSLFVPDAFTNPEYLRFAFKSTLAVMVVYSIYTLLNYPGMRTSIVTCFFVALGTLGETVHKLVLRISGAVIGGIAAALCIVFLLPSFTDIGQLSMLVAGVAAVFAWIATSSERLSYAGMQMAFAFFLGLLQGYAPATDLTVLRDSVAGILLGNIVITITFSLLWPESANKGLRAALADLFHAISSLIRSEGSAADEARLRTTTALVRIDNYSVMQSFELNMLASSDIHRQFRNRAQALDRLAGAALVASSNALVPYARPTLMDARARWADEAAGCVLNSSGLPPAPVDIPPLSQGPEGGVEPTAAGRADRELQREIENVVGSAI